MIEATTSATAPLDRAALEAAVHRLRRLIAAPPDSRVTVNLSDVEVALDAVDALLKVQPASNEDAEQAIAAAGYENIHQDAWRLRCFRAGERRAFRELRLPPPTKDGK